MCILCVYCGVFLNLGDTDGYCINIRVRVRVNTQDHSPPVSPVANLIFVNTGTKRSSLASGGT